MKGDPAIAAALEASAEAYELMQPILAGRKPEEQSAILADLTSLWIAGHVIRGDAGATAELREQLLTGHVQLIRDLVPASAEQLGTEP